MGLCRHPDGQSPELSAKASTKQLFCTPARDILAETSAFYSWGVSKQDVGGIRWRVGRDGSASPIRCQSAAAAPLFLPSTPPTVRGGMHKADSIDGSVQVALSLLLAHCVLQSDLGSDWLCPQTQLTMVPFEPADGCKGSEAAEAAAAAVPPRPSSRLERYKRKEIGER